MKGCSDDGAIAVAEVEGYGEMLARDGRGIPARLEAIRADMIDPLLADSGGHMVSAAGGRWVMAFEGAGEAVVAALFFQHGMVQREAPRSEDDRIRFRIAIAADDDRAANLAALAQPGGVAVTGPIYERLAPEQAGEFSAAGAPAAAYEALIGDGGARENSVAAHGKPPRRLSNSTVGWAIMLLLMLLLAASSYL